MDNWKIIEVKSSGIRSWYGGAYVTAFVYSDNGNFILKGFYKEVKIYLRSLGYKYFVNYTLWYKKEHRSIWDFWKKTVSIIEKSGGSRFCDSKSKWEIYDDKNYVKFKRLPRKWVKEMDIF